MPDLKERLEHYLKDRGVPLEIEELHPDASTRGYFRVPWDGATAVACIYPEEFDPNVGIYIDVTGLFLAGGLPVADIVDFDVQYSVVMEEDLGNRILRDVLLSVDAGRREELLHEAIKVIARVQAATPLAFELQSIASKLKFDTEKLTWELDYFRTHYFTTLKGRPLNTADERALSQEFTELSAELESYARVLCHRDFHAANLMLDDQGRMRIIDHQDARIGSPAYDLVSILLDRITELPEAGWLGAKQKYFLDQRDRLGLSSIDNFEYEFRLQTIQRCLKAAGTFSYQSAIRGKTHFVPFIKPMFAASLSAAGELGRFPNLQKALAAELTA